VEDIFPFARGTCGFQIFGTKVQPQGFLRPCHLVRGLLLNNGCEDVREKQQAWSSALYWSLEVIFKADSLGTPSPPILCFMHARIQGIKDQTIHKLQVGGMDTQNDAAEAGALCPFCHCTFWSVVLD